VNETGSCMPLMGDDRKSAVMTESTGRTMGHDEGFDEFFVRMLPRTIRVARRLTGDPWTAEDVAVEALARAHARWARVKPLPWRDAWVLKVASREALHHLRHRPPLPAAVARRDEADDVALRVALVAALVHLPRRQRDTIVLRYLCDLPESDVAAALGISAGTVKTHLHRALGSLRANFGTDFEEGYVHELHA
ncbi:MAG TPA: SigE family RNA polymerase sigma factor, partial [Acidimicrobiales bacterium]|nr:SigE family RNA polymerase sigma factor [Acidimicrobiales bacterium]